MARPRYQITSSDFEAARGWIGRHLPNLPGGTIAAFKSASTPETLQAFVDRYLSEDQRQRLLNTIRQARYQVSHGKVTLTLPAEAYDDLLQLLNWRGHKESTSAWLAAWISEKWRKEAWERLKEIQEEEGRFLPYEEAIERIKQMKQYR